MSARCRINAVATVCGALLLATGCSGGAVSGPSDADRETAIALKLAGVKYGEFLAASGGAPPKDAETFRTFVEARLADLENNNVKSPDDILKSRRDGQPFAVICGKRIASPEQPDTPWALYETTGVDGKRMISSVIGAVVELTPDEFARQVPGAL